VHQDDGLTPATPIGQQFGVHGSILPAHVAVT
jgi:hypothetical protein